MNKRVLLTLVSSNLVGGAFAPGPGSDASWSDAGRAFDSAAAAAPSNPQQNPLTKLDNEIQALQMLIHAWNAPASSASSAASGWQAIPTVQSSAGSSNLETLADLENRLRELQTQRSALLETPTGEAADWISDAQSVTDSDIISITSARGLHSISESAGFDPNAPIAASRMMQVQTKLNQYKLRLREALAKKKQLQAEMALQTERAKFAHDKEKRERDELNARIAELSDACATKDAEIGALKEQLAELEGNTDLHRQLADAMAAVESLQAELGTVKTAATELKKQAAKMQVELDKARAKSAAQATEIDKLIMASVAEHEATKLELARAAAEVERARGDTSAIEELRAQLNSAKAEIVQAKNETFRAKSDAETIAKKARTEAIEELRLQLAATQPTPQRSSTPYDPTGLIRGNGLISRAEYEAEVALMLYTELYSRYDHRQDWDKYVAYSDGTPPHYFNRSKNWKQFPNVENRKTHCRNALLRNVQQILHMASSLRSDNITYLFYHFDLTTDTDLMESGLI